MKNRIFVIVFVILSFVVGNIHATEFGLPFGIIYNPLSPDYIMGSFGYSISSGSRDINDHAFIFENKLSVGVLTYRYDAPNPFTAQHETKNFWTTGLIFEDAFNVKYQYTINDNIGLQFGGGFTWLFCGAFGHTYLPGLGEMRGSGAETIMGMQLYGIVGAVIFPRGKIPIVVNILPGIILDSLDDYRNMYPFILPVSISIDLLTLKK